MALVEFEKWFEGNESKFEYPRLAHKSAKQAWNYQQDKIDSIVNLIDKYQYSSGELILKEVKDLLKWLLKLDKVLEINTDIDTLL